MNAAERNKIKIDNIFQWNDTREKKISRDQPVHKERVIIPELKIHEIEVWDNPKNLLKSEIQMVKNGEGLSFIED